MTDAPSKDTGSDSPLDGAIERFLRYEELDQARESGVEEASRHFTEPIEVNRKLLDKVLEDPDVEHALKAYGSEYASRVEQIRGLGATGLKVPDAEAESRLAEREKTPKHRLYMHYLTKKALSESIKIIPEETPVDGEAKAFFDEPVESVAKKLQHKKLVVGDRSAIIMETRAQNGKNNAKYLGSREIFKQAANDILGSSDKIYDAYVASVQGGGRMLFLRAGTEGDSCVAVTKANIDGQDYELPTKVGTAMGFKDLPGEMLGKVRFENGSIVLYLEERKVVRQNAQA